MSTVSDLIKGSLRLLGAIAQGETPSSNASADGLSVLNEMLDSWSNEGLILFDRTIETFSLVASTASYTIGTGATFNTARPIRLIQANAKQSGDNSEFPIRILNSDEYSRIIDKTIQSNLPLSIYYNDTFPTGTIYVWPVPSAAASLILYSDKPLSNFSLIADTVSLPPGYKEAMRYNLAVRLAPEYGRPISQDIAMIASESKAAIMRTNNEPVYMQSDVFGLVGDEKQFNIYTGL